MDQEHTTQKAESAGKRLIFAKTGNLSESKASLFNQLSGGYSSGRWAVGDRQWEVGRGLRYEIQGAGPACGFSHLSYPWVFSKWRLKSIMRWPTIFFIITLFRQNRKKIEVQLYMFFFLIHVITEATYGKNHSNRIRPVSVHKFIVNSAQKKRRKNWCSHKSSRDLSLQ